VEGTARGTTEGKGHRASETGGNREGFHPRVGAYSRSNGIERLSVLVRTKSNGGHSTKSMERFTNLCCLGCAVLSAKGSALVAKDLYSLPVVLMDEAAEAIAAHDQAVGVDVPDLWSALG